MQPADNSALLRQYVENHSDEAFAALVSRHINLVYSVALRQVGNPHQAEEITQAVFIILAKKAAGLRHDKTLSSWLFQVTHLTAKNFTRSEARRHRREQEAYMQTILNESENEIWPKITPLLDAAVAGLNEKERRAIVLRFYEGRNLREVGFALGASEEAAKKRVNRALEKLQNFFARHGVTSTTATLAGAMSANSVQVAPALLAKTTTAMALTKGAAASASTLTLAKGALKIMAWSKAKYFLAATATVVLVAGTTAFLSHSASLASIDGTFRSVLFKHQYQLYAKHFEGTWEGKMAILMNSEGWTQHRRVVVKVLEDNGTYCAVVDEIDDGLKNIFVPTLTLDKLAINFASDSFSYHGVFHKDGTEIRGVWRYPHGGSYVLVLTRTNNPDTLPAPLAKEDYAPRPDSDLQGVWKAVLTNNSIAQTVYLKIAQATDGTLRAECKCLGESPIIPLPVTGLAYNKPQLHFNAWAMGGSFTGVVNEANSTLSGRWKHSAPFTGTKTSRLVWTRVNPDEEKLVLEAGKNFEFTHDTELQGHWSGTFPTTFGVALNLVLNIAQLQDGTYSATLDSPDQSLLDMRADVLEFQPPKVRLEVKYNHCTFEGRLMDGKLSGAWSIQGISRPVVLERKKP